MKLLAVNLGKPERIPSKTGMTGIFKRPQTGPLRIGKLGLEGDAVLDRKHHGGVDQAIYVYFQSDYDFWDAQMGTRIQPGTFGENLTTEGLDVSHAVIGEVWSVGSARLQLTDPRIPCRTFAGWLGQRGWIRKFTEAARPGVYLRVLQPGAVTAGDEIRLLDRPDHEVTVETAFRALTIEPERLPELLVDQGDMDGFLEEQLKPGLLAAACAEAGIPADIWLQPGYDHSYYFISSFMAEHVAWHGARLRR